MLNKRVIFSTIFAILIIGASVYSLIKEPKEKTANIVIEKADGQSVVFERDAKLLKDGDQDKLMDWEEELWKTDKNNPDTDGDTVSDFDEIRAGRNPALFGDGNTDKLDAETIATKINSEIEADLTETEKFGREFFSTYIGALNANEPFNYEAMLADKIDKTNPLNEIKIYENSDFQIIKNETGADVKEYANQIGKIISDNSNTKRENELIIVARATNSGNDDDLKDLESAISQYQNIRNSLLATPVPESVVEIHKKMTNLISIISESVKTMLLVNKDPVKALGGLSLYPDSIISFTNTIQELKDYLLIRQIKFDNWEYGSILLR